MWAESWMVSVSQPLSPFVISIAITESSHFFNIAPEFLPGKNDDAAEEIVNELQLYFSMKNHDAQASSIFGVCVGSAFAPRKYADACGRRRTYATPAKITL